MGLVLWTLLLALAEPLINVDAAVSPVEMEPRLWQHELKNTYCQLIQRQQIFKMEQLDIYCAGKVAFFDDDLVSIMSKICSCLTVICYSLFDVVF